MTTSTTDARDVWRGRWTLSKHSARTIETYERGIDRWFAFCDLHGIDVFAAEQHNVDAYWHTFVGASPATIARHLATVSSFYRHVLRHARPALIDHNPVQWVERPEVETVSRRHGLDKTEALALREMSLGKDARTAALVHLLLGTAVRVSEAVGASVDGLGWSDDGTRTLAVVRKGGRPDVVAIEPGDWAVIEHYLAERPEVAGRHLLATTGGRCMSRRTAYRLVRELADDVTDHRKVIGPHSLRHTFATLALDAGLPMQEVQGALRHSSASTTQRYDRAARERGRGASRAVAALWTAEKS